MGDPKGEAHYTWYDTKLCTNCGLIYYVIEGDTHGIEVKPEQHMEETNWDIKVLVNTNLCPKCNIELKQGREVLNQLINRDKCWKKFQLDETLKEEDMLKCPQCKKDFLLYDKFWRAD